MLYQTSIRKKPAFFFFCSAAAQASMCRILLQSSPPPQVPGAQDVLEQEKSLVALSLSRFEWLAFLGDVLLWAADKPGLEYPFYLVFGEWRSAYLKCYQGFVLVTVYLLRRWEQHIIFVLFISVLGS